MRAYDTYLFIREGGGVRMNSVWLTHAQITRNSTSLMSQAPVGTTLPT